MNAEFRTQYRSRLVRIGDWTCRPRAAAEDNAEASPGREEASPRHEIVFVRAGAFRRHLGGRSQVADPANALFFSRDQPYRISHPLPGGDRCLVLSIEEAALGEISGRETHPFPASTAPVDPRMALRVRRLAAGAAAAPPGGMLEVDEAALLLAGEVLRGSHAPRVSGPRRDSHPLRPAAWIVRSGTRAAHRRAVERVRLLAAERFSERLPLEFIAREAACSPYHLCRLFREQTGMPIHRYVNRLRLLAAIEGLGQGADLSRLAHETGFASHSHFSAVFRRELGQTPSAARRSIGAHRLWQYRKILTAGGGAPR